MESKLTFFRIILSILILTTIVISFISYSAEEVYEYPSTTLIAYESTEPAIRGGKELSIPITIKKAKLANLFYVMDKFLKFNEYDVYLINKNPGETLFLKSVGLQKK